MNKGFWFVLLSAILFGTNGIWIKFAYSYDVDPWNLLLLQSIFSSVSLIVVAVIWQPKAFKVAQPNLKGLALQGVIGTLGTSLTFTLALQYISAGLTTLILYTYPAFVTLGSLVFFKRTVSRQHFIALIIVFIGALLSIGVFTLDVGELHVAGLGLAFTAALCYSFFNLYGEKLMDSYKPLTVTLYGQLFSTLGMLIIHPPWNLLGNANLESLYFGIMLALVASVLPFFLILKGIALIGANTASIISTIELPTAILLAYGFLGEAVTSEQVAGAVMILLGVIIVNTGYGKSTLPEG